MAHQRLAQPHHREAQAGALVAVARNGGLLNKALSEKAVVHIFDSVKLCTHTIEQLLYIVRVLLCVAI